jgi:hypothetical protein
MRQKGALELIWNNTLIAMLFDVDDAGLADHPNYPADLVRHYRASA